MVVARRKAGRKTRLKPIVAKEVSAEDRAWGVVGYLGILGIIPLLLKKDNKWIYNHAKQGIALSIASTLVQSVGMLFLFFPLSVFASRVLSVIIVILWVIALVHVVIGQSYKMPVFYNIVKKF